MALRRLKFTQAQIAKVLALSKSRVQRVVAAEGLGKLSALEPPVRAPGDESPMETLEQPCRDNVMGERG